MQTQQAIRKPGIKPAYRGVGHLQQVGIVNV
jgi:hypothetical protein